MSRSLVGSSSTSRLAGPRQLRGQQQPVALAARERADGRARLLRPEQEIAQIADDVLPSDPAPITWSPPAGQSVCQGVASGSSAVAALVDAADREVGAEPDHAGVGRQLAGQQAQQRGLAAAVRADDADAIAAHDAGREIPDDRAIAEALGDRQRFDHQPAARWLGHGSELDPTLRRRAARHARARNACRRRSRPWLRRRRAVMPWCDQSVSTSIVRSSLRRLGLLRRQDLLGPGLERAEALIQRAQPAAIEPPDRAADRAEEGAIVADHDQSRRAGRRGPPRGARWSAGRDDWSARRAGARRARRPGRGRGRPAAPRRRKDPRCVAAGSISKRSSTAARMVGGELALVRPAWPPSVTSSALRRGSSSRLLRQIGDGAARLRCSRSPPSSSISPASALSRVDLPAPLRPTRQMRSASPTASAERR